MRKPLQEVNQQSIRLQHDLDECYLELSRLKTVPITRFFRGEVRQIFRELRETSPILVMKNNVPVGVIISPGQYEALIENLEDFSLFMEAEKRMKMSKAGDFISSDQLIASLGIRESELENIDVEIN